MGNVTRADIEDAINGVTGNPDVGPVADIQPQIVNAIDELLNPAPAKEARVIKPTETRKTKDEE